MRRFSLSFATLVALLALAGTAIAANVHLKGGSNAEPVFTDNGLTLSASGALTGLGNQNLVVTLEAVGQPRAVCVNPSGKNEPPGQNPAPVTLTGSQSIPASKIKNGNVSFNVRTAGPVSPVPGAPDCPNPNWTERIIDVAFSSATITVEQPAGTTVLTVNCTFSSPTRDGLVSSRNVTCSSS